MDLAATTIDIGTDSPIVLLNEEDAGDLGAHPIDRVQIRTNGKTHVGIVKVTDELVGQGTIGLSRPLHDLAGDVSVTIAPKPGAVRYIRKKLEDIELDKRQLRAIVQDINQNRLSDIELAAYVVSIYANGLSRDEICALTECMIEVGDTIEWEEDVIADKHSIGGVAGNRVTPIIVPIVAAAGVKIPKTSSKAVTSPAGTADTMEVFCDVEFDLKEIRSIVRETNGCLVWGGAVNLSPVDDKIIRAETPLSIDPDGQLISSVLSKKRSAGSTHIIIDLPYGEGAKVENITQARTLAKEFKHVGDHLDMRIECTITRGGHPIGSGIGPILEARDVLEVLKGNGPEELKLKSIRLANILFETCTVDADAKNILETGAALEKFREIIRVQGGDPAVSTDDLQPGSLTQTIRAGRSGLVSHVNNELISEIARRAGAPKDKAAGIYLHNRRGAEVSAGEDLFTIYATKEDKLTEATDLAERTEPIRVRSRDEALVERL